MKTALMLNDFEFLANKGSLHQDFPWDHLDQRRLKVLGVRVAARMPGEHLTILSHSGRGNTKYSRFPKGTNWKSVNCVLK